ncbi:hypothetical protein C2L71_03010 [Enteroscipio rubneri]|uniref:Uncharacterized protein n=1 Tax=Enteroscipio rubneri TaxID=2070686 RepID=A0A2K2UDB9_9ACTN|nr:hypothetical protein C2L71_03010 [Enteroscipio rubneri]
MKRFGGKKGLDAVRDLRKRTEDNRSAVELGAPSARKGFTAVETVTIGTLFRRCIETVEDSTPWAPGLALRSG